MCIIHTHVHYNFHTVYICTVHCVHHRWSTIADGYNLRVELILLEASQGYKLRAELAGTITDAVQFEGGAYFVGGKPRVQFEGEAQGKPSCGHYSKWELFKKIQ